MISTASTTVPPARGAFIVLEGLDRSGKTTQVNLLEKHFIEQGKKVQVMRFPDRTTNSGKAIDSYLKGETTMDDHIIHLLFSINRWEKANTIASLLSEGVTVLCDRYYYSGIVYSAAKQNPTLDLAWARGPEVGLPRPDLVLFLDLSEEQAKARGGWGEEVYEKVGMQKRVRELFWGLSMGRIGTVIGKEGEVAVGPPTPERVTGLETKFREEEEDLHIVDASPSIEEVASHVRKVAKARVEAVERGEVGTVVRRVT